MKIRETLLPPTTHTPQHITRGTTGRSAPFCGIFTPKETLEQDKHSLSVLLFWCNIALVVAFILICSF